MLYLYNDKTSVRDCTFLALDIETTGLSPRWNRILEIGALKFRLGEPLREFQVLVDPGCPIPAEVTAIHGITDDMVKGASSLEEALCAFNEFWGEEPLVLHNPRFDLSFLDGQMSLIEERWLDTPVFDTCSLAKKVYPGMKSYSLEYLSRQFSISGSGHHRALEDCRYCSALFDLILKEVDFMGFLDMSCLVDQYRFRP
ncbi:3'-5' exonuclease [Dethiosulfovibrio salsuginis]|uniref:DNA polymerase-3 subunit epsilon n=1 Tax=Dethiosulfovibrio salsuginis TaxID=561720 RepID=A0A1X7JWH9_9BACT|nr:3'-5' exonuclease [Dethiosulfovibrio salsuginis]SMG32603.1 DNA polymerase-3 subunit epsilon [Dethiosulfovibrio salsuginis]